MKNLKNFAFGLLVAVLAISTQAFTSGDSQDTVNRATHYYGWNGTAYELIGPSYNVMNCSETGEVCVKILVTDDQAPQTISLQDAEQLDSPNDASDDGTYNF